MSSETKQPNMIIEISNTKHVQQYRGQGLSNWMPLESEIYKVRARKIKNNCRTLINKVKCNIKTFKHFFRYCFKDCETSEVISVTSEPGVMNPSEIK